MNLKGNHLMIGFVQSQKSLKSVLFFCGLFCVRYFAASRLNKNMFCCALSKDGKIHGLSTLNVE